MPALLRVVTILSLLPAAAGSAQAPKPLDLVRELSIGQADGPAEYAFGSLGSMAVTPTGAFSLFDFSDSQLRRYDAAQGCTGTGSGCEPRRRAGSTS